MKFPLIVLSLFCIVHSCYSATPCSLIPPGLDRLSHGVDITTFDLFPPDLTQANGFVHTIFDFTCDNKKKWTNPYTNQVYDLPDQVESIVKEAGGQTDKKTDFHLTYQEYIHSKGSKCGLIGIPGIFAFSKSSASIMESINANERVLTEVSAHVSAYRVKLIPPSSEHAGSDMTDYMNKFLSDNYLDNPGQYHKFLTLFGTHFFQESLFGGLMKVDSLTTKKYAMTHTAVRMASEAGIQFLKFLGISGGHSKVQEETDKVYLESSIIKESYYGGTADLIKTGSNGFNNWMKSAQKNPWLFQGHMQSIVTFLPEGSKKKAVETAINVKLNYAYLDELLKQMQILKKNPHINKEEADNFIAHLNTERKKPVPVHAEVVQLGKRVEAFINSEKDKKSF